MAPNDVSPFVLLGSLKKDRVSAKEVRLLTRANLASDPPATVLVRGGGAALLLRSMVRSGTYKRKGGHGGHRSGAGLPPAYWEDQGGRAAATAAKAAVEAHVEETKAKRLKLDDWLQRAPPSSTQPTSSEQKQLAQTAAAADRPESAQPAASSKTTAC